jgi:hypothetical protein
MMNFFGLRSGCRYRKHKKKKSPYPRLGGENALSTPQTNQALREQRLTLGWSPRRRMKKP